MKLKFLRKCTDGDKAFYTDIYEQIMRCVWDELYIPNGPQKDALHEKNDQHISTLVNMYPELWYTYRIVDKTFPTRYITLADYLLTYSYNNSFMQILREKDALKIKSVAGMPILKLCLFNLGKTDATERLKALGELIKSDPKIIRIKDRHGKSIKHWIRDMLIDTQDVFKKKYPERIEMIEKNEDALRELKRTILQVEMERAK
ncbi:MAG: hypothetical protein J6T74_06535 [Clostridia bacterium]|nr:hypothetical protein [Clostridia bacterium]